MYITIDGIDGSGKTSVVEKVAKELGAVVVEQPSPRHLGPLIRKCVAGSLEATPQQLIQLFVADRIALYLEEIGPQLAAGRPVICSRSGMSTYAYQGQDGHKEYIVELHNQFVQKADLAVVLALDVEEAQKRMSGRNGNDSFDGNLEMQAMASHLYLDAAHNHYEAFAKDVEIVDASQSLDETVNEILEVVRACQTEDT